MAIHSYGTPLIGITGSSGKTTTILMLQYILEQQNLAPAVLDTWKGMAYFHRFADTALREQADCMIVEVPADVLRQKQLSGAMFQCGGLTNLAPDHLVACRSEEQYYQVKTGFLHELPAQAKAVIPADDPAVLSQAAEEHLDFITFSLHYPHAMVTAKDLRLETALPTFALTVEDEFPGFSGQIVRPGSARITLPMAGEHNAANALMAATLALLFIADIDAVADALCRFPGIRRNMEVLSASDYRIIDDGARNPLSIRKALTAAEQFHPARILLLHGIYGGAGQTINRCNARELAAWARQNPHNDLVVTRSMYHCKSKHHVRLTEEKAFLEELKENGVDFAYYPDLPDACESVLSHASQGDLVLLLGGPVLNRARDMILRTTGAQRTSDTIVPSELLGLRPAAHSQSVMTNPT